MNEPAALLHLAVALFAGLLIGVERGWAEREAAEGTRTAGVRTFGLIGLAGGLWALLAQALGAAALAGGLLALTALLAVAHWLTGTRREDYGITTAVAALVTFALGALAVTDHLAVAAAGAVVTALLLGMKPRLHEWLRHLEAAELYGALKLLLVSVVLLPVLPDRGYGPWDTLNPYQIWWMVVLIATISFVGYVAVRVAGARRGLMLTALAGGLFASTAVALSYARLGKRDHRAAPLLAAGVMAASGTMFPRVLLVSAVVQPALLPRLAVPLLVMLAVAWAAAWLLWRSAGRATGAGEVEMRNPFELRPALQFGVLLALIMLAAKAVREWLGDAGVYVLAGLSGITDVDAITLSLSRFTHEDLAIATAAGGIVTAALANTVVKAALVVALGGRAMGLRVAGAAAAVLGAGAVALLVTP